MEKMRMESLNLTSQNVEKIELLFPNCITESRDENGQLKKSVNFKMLKQILSEDIVDGEEAYEFTWVGKKESIVEANKPIRKTLRPAPEESVDWDNTENLYIEGDNLEVLKLLQESYLGKVKVIYIDPPYNTGNDFIYNDDFKVSNEEYAEESGEYDEDGNRMFKNTDSNGRFHSDWCSMIYSRLLVAKNLLREDGVIFISIDDNELENLEKICNEIFGKENFIANITRNTNSSKNQSLFVSVSHEYCLVYSKNINELSRVHSENKWSVDKNNIDEYRKRVQILQDKGLSNDEITAELKELTKYPRFIDFTNYWYLDDRGLYRKDSLGGVKNGNNIAILNPLTGEKDPIPPGGFRYKKEKLDELIMNDRIHFHNDGSLPTIKRYLEENRQQRPKSIMSDDQRPDNTMLKNMGLSFDNPKQLAFIKRILSIFKENDIYMDFFSGSSTTAHAVMELNADDNGNRKFIMVQLPEETDEKSEAHKAGYKNICEIGKERIRRAGDKIKKDNPLLTSNLDIGFRVLKVDSSNMKDVYYSPNEISQDFLSALESNVKEDRTDLDLLFGCLLEWGLPLSLPYKSIEIDGCVIHNYNDGDLIACFEESISENVMKEIAKLTPLRAVFRDSSFENSAEKINTSEIFKLLSPDTKIKVI
ncbi:site-specific DNA-methyltransferase [Gemella sp.]